MKIIAVSLELGDAFGSPPCGRRVHVVMRSEGFELRPEVWVATPDPWGDEGKVVIIRYNLPENWVDVETLRKCVAMYFKHAMVELAAMGLRSSMEFEFEQGEPYAPWRLIGNLPPMWRDPSPAY